MICLKRFKKKKKYKLKTSNTLRKSKNIFCLNLLALIIMKMKPFSIVKMKIANHFSVVIVDRIMKITLKKLSS